MIRTGGISWFVQPKEDEKLHWLTAVAQTTGRHCESVKFTTFCYNEGDGGGRPQQLCHCSL